MKYIFLIILFSLFLACKNEKSSDTIVPLTAKDIVDKAIDTMGVGKLANAKLSFQFRGKQYLANRTKGQFVLARLTVTEDNDSVFDVLSNAGFERFVNNEPVQLPDSLIARYEPSVNSVHYFSGLPYGLNDKAVHKELLGNENIKGKDYYKIKVTFSEDGGGEDFDDVFLYWIDSKTFKMHYLAYSYKERSGVGLRFREAYNTRVIKGVHLSDYNNFKPKDLNVALESLGTLFETDKLELLSKIELDSIQIDLIDNL